MTAAIGQRRAATPVGVVLVLLGLVGMVLWLANRAPTLPIDRSAIGLRALERVVSADGGAISYAVGQRMLEGTLGLRILPILDTDVSKPFVPPEDEQAYLATGTERDLTPGLIRGKVRLQPTLLVAPKWTRAMRHSGYAHHSLMISPEQAVNAIDRLDAFDGPLLRPRAPLQRFNFNGHDGLLYAPQFFPETLSDRCVPLISTQAGHLLIECDGPQSNHPVWLLSDPDLINNHGITLASNAAIASETLRELAAGAPILIDTTDEIFSTVQPQPRPKRAWSDLLRFFAYPMSIAWIALLAFTVLVLWRAWVRFGPPLAIFDDRLSASRDASISAKARILRMVGNDPKLFEAHVANRLRRIERTLFGGTLPGDPVTRIVGFLKRVDPERAAGFAAAAVAATTPAQHASAAQLQAALDDFERQAERLFDGS
ncbi:MAG: hypothetical protein AAGA19_10440 [Pseudomonadota bacterium]